MLGLHHDWRIVIRSNDWSNVDFTPTSAVDFTGTILVVECPSHPAKHFLHPEGKSTAPNQGAQATVANSHKTS